MLLGIPVNELWLLALAVVLGGIVTGILAGLFGIGGGAVIVPVLYEVFGLLGVSDSVRMQLCIGTSIAIIVPTTFWSYRAHLAKGAVLDGVVRRWALPAVCGVAVGALAAAFLPGTVFKVAFIVIASFIALKLLFARESWRLGGDLPKDPLMSAYGFLVGLASSLMGVSGGSVSNLVLTLYGKPIHNAVATSSGAIFHPCGHAKWCQKASGSPWIALNRDRRSSAEWPSSSKISLSSIRQASRFVNPAAIARSM
jgi:uncharacterized protein